MTKKHFIQLANVIREHNATSPEPFTESQLSALERFCSVNNSQFMGDRWRDYIAGKCGPNGGKR